MINIVNLEICEVITMAFSFRGGVHPKENKVPTRDRAIQAFPAPDVLVVPLSQHIGAPCAPLVKKGDTVTMGQMIGDGPGLCVPVHSPVSGKVKAVEPRPHPGGTTVLSVVIENDHLDTLCETVRPRTEEQVAALSGEELIEIIRQAGIAGMGGAGFPTHVKLSSSAGKVDTVIVNVGECEPYITADDRLCREMPEKMLSGLKIIMRILGVDDAHIAIENNKPEAIASLRRVMDPGDGMTLEILPAKYPQGAEKQLIYATTGRVVSSGGLPASVGCGVFNGATCKAIHDAVYDGMPLIRRVVTVSGDIVMDAKNLLVPLGTSYHDLVEAVGTATNPYKVLSGGPMMGVTQFDLSVPIIKGSNAVTILGPGHRFAVREPHCIRCGKCMQVCPMGLMPLKLYQAERSGDVEEMKSLHLMDCIECGCCAYTCPATLHLVQSFRTGKQRIRDSKK